MISIKGPEGADGAGGHVRAIRKRDSAVNAFTKTLPPQAPQVY